MCVCDPHPRLLTGRVSFGITKNEPDILAELDGRLVLSFRQRVENSAEVHRWFNYLQVVLEEAEGQLGYFIFHWIVFKRWQKGERERWERSERIERFEVFTVNELKRKKNLNQKWKNCILLLLKGTQGHWSCESDHIISFTTWMKRPLPQTALIIIELEPLVLQTVRFKDQTGELKTQINVIVMEIYKELKIYISSREFDSELAGMHRT